MDEHKLTGSQIGQSGRKDSRKDVEEDLKLREFAQVKYACFVCLVCILFFVASSNDFPAVELAKNDIRS